MFSHKPFRLSAKLSGALTMLLVLGLASEAVAARTETAIGFYRAQRGSIGIPLQLLAPTPNHAMFFMFPNDDAVLSGTVQVMGNNPATLTIPKNRVSGTYAAGIPLGGSALVQITSSFPVFRGPVTLTAATGPPGSCPGGTPCTTTFHTDATTSMGLQKTGPNGAVFMAGGGPGNFTWCPSTLGTMTGMPAASCPPLTTGMGVPNPPAGPGTRNGRVVYVAGSNSFGGVSQLVIAGRVGVGQVRAGFGFGSPIFQAFHRPAGGMIPAINFVPVLGGSNGTSAGIPRTTMALMFNAAPYTQPKTQPTTAASITASQAGPLVALSMVGTATASGLTACPTTAGGTLSTMPAGMAFPNIPLTGPNACNKIVVPTTGTPTMTVFLQKASGSSPATGFPFTTGTVFAQQTTNTDAAGGDAFTQTGSDDRTPFGVGNITLVSGGIGARAASGGGSEAGANSDTISILVGKPVPAMSPSGFAAAAVLMVLAVGYAMRRRF